jgi:NADH-quinone oxidoreductase subunit E
VTDFEPTEIVNTFGSDGVDTPLISVLEEIQARHRYLPREAMILVSERLGLPLSQVYSVATFYNAFSLERHGKHSICVCQGTACHVRGAARIRAHLENKLGIQAGQSTPDWKYYLETVNCLGACALGPIVVADEHYHGQMTERKVDQMLADIEQDEMGDAR